MLRSGQRWRWPENSPCCFIVCGFRRRSTSHYITPGAWGFKERR